MTDPSHISGTISAQEVAELKAFLKYVVEGNPLDVQIAGPNVLIDAGGPCAHFRVAEHDLKVYDANATGTVEDLVKLYIRQSAVQESFSGDEGRFSFDPTDVEHACRTMYHSLADIAMYGQLVGAGHESRDQETIDAHVNDVFAAAEPVGSIMARLEGTED